MPAKKPKTAPRPKVLTSIQTQLLTRIGCAQHYGCPLTPEVIEATWGRGTLSAAQALRKNGIVKWGVALTLSRSGRERIGPMRERFGPAPKSPLGKMLAMARLLRSKPMSPAQRVAASRRAERRAAGEGFDFVRGVRGTPITYTTEDGHVRLLPERVGYDEPEAVVVASDASTPTEPAVAPTVETSPPKPATAIEPAPEPEPVKAPVPQAKIERRPQPPAREEADPWAWARGDVMSTLFGG